MVDGVEVFYILPDFLAIFFSINLRKYPPKIVDFPISPYSSTHIYFEVVITCKNIWIVMSSRDMKLFNVLKCPLSSLVIFFPPQSTLSCIHMDTTVFLFSLVNTLFHPFTFTLLVTFNLKWVSYGYTAVSYIFF